MSSTSQSPGSPPLRAVAASGVKWTAGATAIGFAVQLVQLGAYGVFLSPKDFGIATSAMVVVNFANAFSDMGISSAIIAKQTQDRLVLSSLYWASLLTGVVVAIAVAAISPLIARFFDESTLDTLLPLAALSFVIIAAGQQFQILLQRDLAFRQLAVSDTIATLVGSVAGIVSAAAGAGAFAVIIALLSGAATRTLVLAVMARRYLPLWHFRRRDLDGYLGFGLYQMGERSVNSLASNMDYLIIGRSLGAHDLGIYSLAYQIVVTPLVRLNPILNRVAFPILALRRDDNAALRRAYTEVIRFISFVSFPALVGLAIAGPVVIPGVFGTKWDESGDLVRVLALLGACKAISNPSGSLFLAKDRPEIGFRLNVVLLVVVGTTIAVAVQFGLFAAAWSYTCVAFGTWIVVALLVRSLIQLPLRVYVAAVARPLLLCVPMGVAVWIATERLVSNGRATYTQVALLIVIGIATYIGVAMVVERGYLRSLQALARTKESTRAVTQRTLS